MSIYTRCADVIAELRDRGGVFTDIDVALAVERKSWSKEKRLEAMRQANNECGRLYRAGQLCRYGPVVPPDDDPDYARIGAHIVYADAEDGPERWSTPNGDFPRLHADADKIVRRGRGRSRDDQIPWVDDQINRLRRRIRRLEDARARA